MTKKTKVNGEFDKTKVVHFEKRGADTFYFRDENGEGVIHPHDHPDTQDMIETLEAKRRGSKKPAPRNADASTIKAEKKPGKISVLKRAPKDFTPHEITQEDLDANPDLVSEGVVVGETIYLPPTK
jgi:hypothetical protein